MRKIVSILDYVSTQKWNEQLVRQKPPMTVKNYIWGLEVFCNWTKKNPDELISERLKEIATKTRLSDSRSIRRITDYQVLDKSKTKQSKAMIVKAVASFYENNRASISVTAV